MSLPYYKSTLMAKLNESLQAINKEKDIITRWYGSHDDKEIVRHAQHNDGLLNSHLFNNHKNSKRKFSEQNQKEEALSESSSEESSESHEEPETELTEEDNTKYKEYTHNSNEKKESEKNDKRKGNKMNWKTKNNVIIDDSVLDNAHEQWVSCDILQLIDTALLHGVPEDVIANNVQILATAMHESVQREAQINALRHHSRVMEFEMREVLNCMERTNVQLEQRDSDLERNTYDNMNREVVKQKKEEIEEEIQEHKAEDTKNIVNEHSSIHEETDQGKARAVLFIKRQSALSHTVDNVPNIRHYNTHSAPSLTELITASHSPTLESEQQMQKYEEHESIYQPKNGKALYNVDENNDFHNANDTECRHRTHHRRLCEMCARLDGTATTLQNYKNYNYTKSSSAIKHHMLPTHSSIRMHRKYEAKGNNKLSPQEEQEHEEENIKEVHELATTTPLQKEQMSNYTKPLFRYRPSVPVRQTHTSRLRLSRSRSNTTDNNSCNENPNNPIDNNDNAYVVDNEKGNVENIIVDDHKDVTTPWKDNEENKVLDNEGVLHQENEKPVREPPHLPDNSAICDALKDITANTMIGVESYHDNAISSDVSNLIDNNSSTSSNAVVSNVYSAKAKRAIRQALRDSKEKMRNADRLLQQCTMNTLSQHK